MWHTHRKQFAYPRLVPDKDEFRYPRSLGRDEIQVSITDCNRFIGANSKLLQDGEKGLRIGFHGTVIATEDGIERERMPRENTLDATTRVVGNECALDMSIPQALQ